MLKRGDNLLKQNKTHKNLSHVEHRWAAWPSVLTLAYVLADTGDNEVLRSGWKSVCDGVNTSKEKHGRERNLIMSPHPFSGAWIPLPALLKNVMPKHCVLSCSTVSQWEVVNPRPHLPEFSFTLKLPELVHEQVSLQLTLVFRKTRLIPTALT